MNIATFLLLFVSYARASASFLRRTESVCSNSKSFTVRYEGKSRDCAWIRDTFEDARQEICQDLEVRSECPYSCGICCADTPEFSHEIHNGKTKMCDWYGFQEEEKQDLYCNYEYLDSGLRFRDICPVSCDNCPSRVKPLNKNIAGAAAAAGSDGETPFPYALVLGTTCPVVVLLIGLIYRKRRAVMEDDLTFGEFLVTPSEWFA